jgi:hypothetical protein
LLREIQLEFQQIRPIEYYIFWDVSPMPKTLDAKTGDVESTEPPQPENSGSIAAPANKKEHLLGINMCRVDLVC